MKTLESQNWTIKDKKDDEDKIMLNFEKYTTGVKLSLTQGKYHINLTQEMIEDLKNILESTKFIFKQII